MTRNERALKATQEEKKRYAQEVREIRLKAEGEDRRFTPEESEEIEIRLKAIENLEANEKEIEAQIAVDNKVDSLSKTLGASNGGGLEFHNEVTVGREYKTIGEVITESDQWKSCQANGFSGEFKMAWDFGAKDFSGGLMMTKGTLLGGGTVSPGGGSGGGLLPVPDLAPGVVTTLFQPPRVADLFMSGQTSAGVVRYVVEGTATNAAAGVAEAGAKPESTLGLSTVDEPVKKIATLLNASDELLNDGPAVQSYINGRLSLFIRLKEDSDLLRGAGGASLAGLAGRSGVNTYPRATATDDNAVAIFKALNGTRGSSFLEPDAIIMHPDNWQATRLLRDGAGGTAGQFYGGGPFAGPYGVNPMAGLSGQVTGANDYLWGKPVIVTTAVGNAGTAILGSFSAGAQIFRREGIRVEATNSHSTYFANNLVAIRAEERLALAVYRPSSFTLVTALA